MKTCLVFRFLVVILFAFLLCTCGLLPKQPITSEPTTVEGLVQAAHTPTPTPTALPAASVATLPPITPLTGTLEIRFPDPWERPEYCSAQIPFVLTTTGSDYELTGQGDFSCHQIMTYEEGFKQHLEQEYTVSLSGSMPIDPQSILNMTVVLEGIQDGYFSDYPHGAPEIITDTNPFHVNIDQPVALLFSYSDNAYCIWNQDGVFTHLPGEEPPLGENGWIFILHPGQQH